MIAVISCVWQRQERLAYTLDQLSKQTYKGFRLYLINNNISLQNKVYSLAGNKKFVAKIYQNKENRGPYARLELMTKLKNEYAWMMTLDDDLDFGETLLEQWSDQRDQTALQGWAGFRFTGGYWEREQAKPGEYCHYLWGSNLFLPSTAVTNTLTILEKKYWQCDDLWLCYHANKYAGLNLKVGKIEGNKINIDGKDTYLSQHDIKINFLEELRKRGWKNASGSILANGEVAR